MLFRSADLGCSSSPVKDKTNQSGNCSVAAGKKQTVPDIKDSSPVINIQTGPRTKAEMNGKGMAISKNACQEGNMVSGQKRKKVQEYWPKAPPMLTAEPVNPLAMVVDDTGSAPVVRDVLDNEAAGIDSNKKRRSVTNGSVDQALVVHHDTAAQGIGEVQNVTVEILT